MESAKIVCRTGLGETAGISTCIKVHQRLSQLSVAEISRSLGLCREHVTRSIQPKAMGLVARVFLPRANDGRSNTITEAAAPVQKGVA